MTVTMLTRSLLTCRWGTQDETHQQRRHDAGRSGRPGDSFGWARGAAAAAGLLALVAGLLAVGTGRAAASTLATPSLSITASTTTIVGLTVFANVNLNGANPTGTVTFKMYGPTDSSCATVMFTSTVAVTGVSLNSDRYTTTAAGTYRWQASYSGDANNAPVGPTACSAPSAAVIVAPYGTAISVAAAPLAGGMIHVDVNIFGYGPTGSIKVLLSPPGDTFCNANVFTSTITVHGNGAYSSANFTPTVAGTYKWQATYLGDPNNAMTPMSACLDAPAAVTVTMSSSPGATLSPSALSFAVQTIGTTSATQSVAVSNPGTAALSVSSVTVTGANAADFGVSGNTCGATVAAGASCNVAVSFAPAAAGARSATLTMADNAAGSPQTVSLTGTGATSQAAFTYPINGQTNVDNTKPFTWSTVPTATSYFLMVGTTANASDLVNSGSLPAGQSSYTVPSLPTGKTLYASIWAYTSSWASQSITFSVAAAQATGPASFTYPLDGQSGVDTTKPFTWTTVAGAQGYFMIVGTTATGYDLVNSGVLPASQSSYPVLALPTGTTLYGTLFTELNGAWSQYRQITFTAGMSEATFTYPVNAQTGVDTTRPFTWSTFPAAQGYFLLVGTTAVGSDLVNSGIVAPTQSSFSVPALPVGVTLYGTLFTEVGGNWNRYQQITFTAGVTAPTFATFTNPPTGQTNVDTTKPFTWSTPAAAQGYFIIVGTTAGGYDLVNSGVLPAGQSSYAVPALPVGTTLYGTLFTEVNGAWGLYQQITFTAKAR